MYPVETSWTNDFVLKTMDMKTATLDVNDFRRGVLVGNFERIVKENGIDTTDLDKMKEVRRSEVNANNANKQ
jgi:hypothetical protein